MIDKFDDYTKIDYSVVCPNEKDYEDWHDYWQDLCEYLRLKYTNCYGSKEK